MTPSRKREKEAPLGNDAIHEFFRAGSQYYVVGRFSVLTGQTPVAGNLLHHTIEMFLKGALSKSMSLKELKNKLGHELMKTWIEFKQRANEPGLDRFDKTVDQLSQFESIRYPDKTLQSGAAIKFDVTRSAALDMARSASALGSTKVMTVPEYSLCLEDIDEMVAAIFRIASRNPAAYLNFLNPEARRFFSQGNNWTANPERAGQG